ncbi:MAG: hypothetical protein LBK53_00710 [Heliobacteriaceae bacterium]|jgi:hypothetical protein|nr:hypothetical protein [Heliobacteriaceae bacterium]
MLDVTKISKEDRRAIAIDLLPILERYYDDPEVRKDFEDWLEKQKKLKELTQG